MNGQQLAERGMQLVLLNESDEWKERFLNFCEARARHLPLFKLEDIRADWLAAGHDEPHHYNVYGAISKQITKRGIGAAYGYAKSVHDAAHARPVIQYRSLKFREAA